MSKPKALEELVRSAESAVKSLRSIESILQEQIDRLVRGQRPVWGKSVSMASDTARTASEELDAAINDYKLKGGDGK